MAARDSYGTFMANDFMPKLEDALKKEDTLLRKRLRGSLHKTFYSDFTSGVLSKDFTEKVLQYFIYRELSHYFKIELETAVYKNSQKKVDFAI